MRVTEQVVVIEAVIGGLLADASDWSVWSDSRLKRQLRVPTFVACHVPSRQTLAVFVRPRRLYPSERPAVDWLPVVWYPTLAGEIRSWLANPDGREPPGLSIAQR